MKNKIRSMSIRIISLISCFMVLISSLIFPAAATENDSAVPYQPYFQDILSLGTEYNILATRANGTTASQTAPLPTATFSSVFQSVTFSWGDSKGTISYDYLYLALKISSEPTSIIFSNAHTGVLLSREDGISFYKFNVSGTFWGRFTFLINLPTNFTGSVSIVSAYAVDDFSSSIDEVNFRVNGQFVSDGQYYSNSIINQFTEFPYTWRKDYDTDSPVSSPDHIFWDISFDMPVPYADSVSFTFSSTNTIDGPYKDETFSDSTGVQIYDGSGTQMILPYTVSSIPALTTISGHFSYIHTVTVNTSGVDFNNGDKLCFRFYMWKVYTNYDNTTNRSHFYHVQLLSLSYQNAIHTTPWYVRFFYWIQQEFTDLISSLSGFFTNLQNFFTTKFSSLETTIKNALGVGQVAPVRPDQDQQIQDHIQDNQQANDDLDNVIGELETAPTLPEFDDTGLDDFDVEVQDQTSPVQPVFVVIFQNPLIFQMITYVFMFALGGFLLYGER